MIMQEFVELTGRGPVILDGATGSNLRAAGMPAGVSPELWILEHPDARWTSSGPMWRRGA